MSSSAGVNFLRMIEDMQRLFTKLYDLALTMKGGVFVIHLAIPNEPGTLGKILTTIEAATGLNLLLAYAYGWPGEAIGYALLVYPAEGGDDMGRKLVEASKSAGAIVLGAYKIENKML
ncbi:MAG: amino acid-binding protein [Vulcanisaeta sp.]|nr:amino acid-binding protein [Vulcanisaeta sp.]